MGNKNKHKDHKAHKVERINGILHRVIPIVDEAGKIVHYAVKPLMVELHFRDVMQIIVGTIILAIPVGFTEEVWDLSATLSNVNIFLIALFSIIFIAVFVYHNFYRNHLRGYEFEYVKRVFVIYSLALIIVAILMTLIGQAQWFTDFGTALRMVIIVALPASMSATLSDTIK